MVRVVVRGCPGQGTRWFASVLPCLFADNATVETHNPWPHMPAYRHAGCTKYESGKSISDDQLSSKLLHPNCSANDDCIHAVIARHPMELRHGANGTYKIWEAYYGAWARLRAPNVRLFRYETLITEGCTAAKADPQIRQSYMKRTHSCVAVNDELAWRFWNYSNSCPG